MGKPVSVRFNISEEQILDELVNHGLGIRFTWEKATRSKAIKRANFVVYRIIQEIGIDNFRKKYDI